MTFYNQFNFSDSLKRFMGSIPKCYHYQNKKIWYCNLACSFDIETSSFYNEKGEKQAIMYIWQFAIFDNVIIGRTWGDFLILLDLLVKFYDLGVNNRLVCYVHNLSYEFQFLRKLFEWEDIFATDERKPLYACTKTGIEFKCSYRLSGYSLAVLAKNLTRHTIDKKVGDLDYSLIRHSDTFISDDELDYCVNDVLIVTSYIQECIEDYGDITKIPLTQTGKVRRYVRELTLKDDDYKYMIRKLELHTMEYLQLRKAFQGGFTHANPMYALQECKDVTSYDFTSSYPTVMVSERFPMSKGKYIGVVSVDALKYYAKNYCCLFDLKLTNVISKYTFENTISFSKCFRIKNYVLNNGRVFSAEELFITITELDFEVICKFYNFDDIEIRNLYIYEKDYLPKSFIMAILKLYNDKTQLKGVQGKEIEYLHSKEMLNSCYGMTVTDLLNDEYIYKNDEWTTKETNIDNVIEDYNKDKNRFLFYPWGVWVTAYARRNLFTGVYECKNDYIYADTDSIKIFNANKHKKYIDNYNVMIENKLNAMCKHYNIDFSLCKPKTKDGIEKMLGVWDYDGKYKMFKSLGAKRYMVYTDDNKLSLTVSGVNKKIAVPYLMNKYNNDIEKIFNAFDDLLVFPKGANGKKILTYIDSEQKGIVKDYQGNIKEYDEKSSIFMEDTEYNLNIACEYLDFILKLNKRSI
jgi:hypothetical protein